ncbi:MAG: hypothetical protein Q9166_001419 [cf. Caloplaca sp. 2 TL-2023]
MSERTKIFEHAEFDLLALCQLASSLRGGKSCSCDPAQRPKSGSFNWTVFLLFDDGVEWVLRSPRKDDGIISDDTNLLLLASEAATLKYIKAYSTIPVPEVFAYRQANRLRCVECVLISSSSSEDNDVGIPYILMSKARGSLLEDAWHNLGSNEPRMRLEDKAKVVAQLGAITWQLSQLPFGQAGSLFEEDGEFQIKTCLSRGMVLNHRDGLEDINRGPFSSDHNFYEGHISAFLEQVKYLPLGYHCFFAPIPARSEYQDDARYLKATDWWNDFVAVQSKIDTSHNRTDYVVAGEALLEMVTKWTQILSGSLPSHDQRHFFLHHPDLSVDNIFVDEKFNITCIIDWAFCSSVPLPMLLTAPGLPQSKNELDEVLLPPFEGGFRNAAAWSGEDGTCEPEDKLFGILSRSRPMWLFSRLISFDSTADYNLFQGLWDSVKTCEKDITEYFGFMHASEKYLSLHTELAEDDPTESQIAAEEDDFLSKDIEKQAIARKLTMVSAWSSRYHRSGVQGIRSNGNIFVADKRLWAWIHRCFNTDDSDVQ